MDFVGEAGGCRQRLQRLPVGGVVRDLNCAFRGAANPREHDAVKGAGFAEVDIDPLFARARAHPRAGEVKGAGELKLLPLIEGDKLTH